MKLRKRFVAGVLAALVAIAGMPYPGGRAEAEEVQKNEIADMDETADMNGDVDQNEPENETVADENQKDEKNISDVFEEEGQESADRTVDETAEELEDEEIVIEGDIDDQEVEDTYYEVKFDLQGKGNAEEYNYSEEYMEGEEIIEPETPEDEVYIFTGWYKDEACTIPWDFDADVVTGNMTLYAGWGLTVKSAKLDPSSLALEVGGTYQLNILFDTENAVYDELAWSSSDKKIAKVNKNGKVTAVSEGNCIIEVEVYFYDNDDEMGKSITARCIVQVNKTGEIGEIASGSYAYTSWRIDADGKLTVSGTGDVRDVLRDEYGNEDDNSEEIPWEHYKEMIFSAEVSVKKMTDAGDFFSSCYNLTNVNFDGFDTKEIVYMTNMFNDCTSLKNLDLSGFSTENVINMESMFSGCENLESLNLSGFSTANVVNMNGMFYNCESLTSLELSSFSTKNVIDMCNMFSCCRSLTSLDLSNFSTENTVGMYAMFSDCNSLTNLALGDISTENVTDMGGMFYGCNNLANLDLSGFSTKNVTDMGGMFYGCNSLTSLDLSSFSTENVIDMGGMFYGCNSLTSLDLSSFSTENVTDMGSMFYGCNSLAGLNLDNFFTEKVTNMRSMFYGCNSLASLDLGSFSTEKVTDMESMFYGCNSLANVNLNRFNMGNVSNVNNIFADCSELAYIKTPVNVTQNILLPVLSGEVWYKEDGTELTELPGGQNYSIAIAKSEVPKVVYPYIVAKSIKSRYVCGDTLCAEDIIVTRFNSMDSREDITGFSMNTDGIDMSVPGSKKLTITYGGLTDSIRIAVYKPVYTVKFCTQGEGTEFLEYEVQKGSKLIPDDAPELEDHIFTGWYKDVECKMIWDFSVDTVEGDTTLYAGWKLYPPLESVKFDKVSLALKPGETYQLNALIVPDDYVYDEEEVEWRSSDKNIAKVRRGRVTAISEGTCVIQLFMDEYYAAACIVHVNESGEKKQIAAGNYKNASWSIDEDGKLTVSGTGDVRDTLRNENDEINEKGEIPWANYREMILSAEISVKGMTDASNLFSGCSNLTDLNFDGFETKDIIDMGSMFSDCDGLTSLDLSSFNTAKVTNMRSMFSGSTCLKSLDLSGFSTENVTDMNGMFYNCYSLESLDLSGFDTSNVIDMSRMFYACYDLADLDLGGFSTGNVTDMSSMFEDCSGLQSLELSGFSTGNVTSMSGMFRSCSSLTSLDLSSFSTERLADMDLMFFSCDSLTRLNLSSFDMKNISFGSDMFTYCDSLAYIKTPVNVRGFCDLPGTSEDIWYQEDGTEITELPLDKDYSIVISKNEIPKVSYPYIVARKVKTYYACGDRLNVEDITVSCFKSMGNREAITDFSTNADEIDMSVPGSKELIITYGNLRDIVKLTVRGSLVSSTYTVVFNLQGRGTEIPKQTGINKGSKLTKPADPEAKGYIFTGWYKDVACITAWNFDEDTVEANTILYAGWKEGEKEPEEETTYTVAFDLQSHGKVDPAYESYTNIKAGSKIQIPGDPEEEGYIFTGWYKEAACENKWNFDIDIVEDNITLYAGWIELGDVLPQDVPEDTKIPEGQIWTAPIKDITYTGKAVKPEVHIYWGKERLDEGVDYTLKYRNNTKANDGSEPNKAPQITVKYKKHFSEKQQETIYYKILPVNLEDVTVDDLTLALSKKVQKKVPTATWLGKKLVKGKDFDISYPDEGKTGAYQEKGEYVVLLTAGKSGNFTGSKTVNLTITDMIPVSKVSVKVKSQLYDKGNPVQPEPKVTYKGKALEKDVDYTVSYQNNTEIGTASAVITGAGKYQGTKKVNFKITGMSIKRAAVSGLTEKEYTGAAQIPEGLTVALGGKSLKEGSDYSVSYTKNRNAGKATVIISGKGQYTGTVKKTFKIKAYDLKLDESRNENRLLKGLEADISVSLSEYTKGICKPEPVLTFKGRVLRKGRDYTLSYKNNKKAATATDQKAPTIVIKGKGNFKGTVQKAFTITE